MIASILILIHFQASIDQLYNMVISYCACDLWPNFLARSIHVEHAEMLMYNSHVSCCSYHTHKTLYHRLHILPCIYNVCMMKVVYSCCSKVDTTCASTALFLLMQAAQELEKMYCVRE